MPKRKLSAGQSSIVKNPGDQKQDAADDESQSQLSMSHSAPSSKTMKHEEESAPNVVEVEGYDNVVTINSRTSDQETQRNDRITKSEEDTIDSDHIAVREEVYVISELSPDKFIVTQDEGQEGIVYEENVETTIEEEFECVVQSEEPDISGDVNMEVQLLDFALCCANCSVQFDEECPKISELILSENEVMEESQLEYGIVVTVSDALSFIFELQLNEERNAERPLVDTGIGLCNKCGNILAQMYKLHRDFYEAATANSYLDLLFSKVFSKDVSQPQSHKLNQSEENKVEDGQQKGKVDKMDAEMVYPDESKVGSNTESVKVSKNSSATENCTSIQPNSTSGSNISSTSTSAHPQNSSSSALPPQPNSSTVDSGSQQNYVVICPLVIAANAGTNTIATLKPEEIDAYCDPFSGTNAQFPRRRRRNRPKYTSTCPECGKTFRSYVKTTLESHINIMHRNLSPYTCNICGRPCSTQKNLDTHVQTHLGKYEREGVVVPKPVITSKHFLCAECGTTLKSKSSLRIHTAKHKNPKPFQCDKCERRFGDRVSLRNHQVIHEEDGIFKFSCGCGQGFKARSQLKEHYLYCVTKSSERPHKCSQCGKQFKLKQHVELHYVEIHKFTKEEARAKVYPGLPRKKRAK